MLEYPRHDEELQRHHQDVLPEIHAGHVIDDDLLFCQSDTRLHLRVRGGSHDCIAYVVASGVHDVVGQSYQPDGEEVPLAEHEPEAAAAPTDRLFGGAACSVGRAAVAIVTSVHEIRQQHAGREHDGGNDHHWQGA